MTQTCECGFEFVPDRPITKPVPAICPRCGAHVTLQPETKRPSKSTKKEAEN